MDGDGKFELVGSFSLKRADAAPFPYELFLLAKPGGLAFEPDMVIYNGDGHQGALLIDQVDLDGDGIAELIVENNHEYEQEGNRIQIYKRQGGRWVVIYERPGWEC